MAASVREFFETLESRIDPQRTAGITADYLFDVAGAGQWLVSVRDGSVSVTEGAGEADCTITASEETFRKIARGEQNAMTAFVTRKIKVSGDVGLAMKLQRLL